MEDLNKQQIVLLTLLVSFVTSIATGITTVSLLDQAPAGVTQTINRVVERTIETVVPVEKPPLPPKEVTVVVKEEDLVIKAVESMKNSIVRIKNKKSKDLLGMGVIVRVDGVVAADISLVGAAKEYEGIYKGVSYTLTYISKDSDAGIAFYKIPVEAAPQVVALADVASIQSGQSIVAVSGPDRDVVSIGIVSSIINTKTKEGVDLIESIETTMGSSEFISGTPFSNLSGQLVAIKVGKGEEGEDVVHTVNLISSALGKIPAQQ